MHYASYNMITLPFRAAFVYSQVYSIDYPRPRGRRVQYLVCLSVFLSVCLSAEFCCLNWHNSKMKSSVTVKLCKGMANDAFYGVKALMCKTIVCNFLM